MTNRLTIFIATIIILVCLSGCGGGSSSGGPSTLGGPDRFVAIFLPEYENPNIPGRPDVHGVAPYEVVVRLMLGYYHTDKGPYPFGDKIEMDFGDGTGWHDVTAKALECNTTDWTRTGGDISTTYIRYTWDEPGTYDVIARAHWPDGMVCTSEIDGIYRFNIISREEADEAFAEGGD